MSDDVESADTIRDTLQELAEIFVPEKDRPRRESLASFSLAADAVRCSQRLEWEEEREAPSVLIQATPEELKAYTEVVIERAVRRLIDSGELRPVNRGGE